MDEKYYEIIIQELYNEIRHRRDYLMKIMSRFGFFYTGVIGWVIAYKPSVGSLKPATVDYNYLPYFMGQSFNIYSY
jgi:hypothetical protein